MFTEYLQRINSIVECFNKSSVIKEITIVTALQQLQHRNSGFHMHIQN